MTRSARFWFAAVVFQVVFGLGIFAVTRQYYMHDAGEKTAAPAVAGQPPLEWPEDSTAADLNAFMSSTSDHPAVTDPAALSELADEYFARKQYSEAADLYAKVLAAGSNNVNTYNSLGITLHYLGRSAEALEKLNQGIAVDPTYQRIWLTLGFVNSQLGNFEQARKALTTAVQMGTDNEVGQSAAEMLENLP